MNDLLAKILLIGLLLLLAIAPFAGLAPLMLILLVFGLGWAIWSLLQVLIFGEADNDSEKA